MVRLVKDLKVEHGVIEGETKANGMSRLELISGLGSLMVRILRLIDDALSVVARLVFTEVSEVVTLHLEVEDDGLGVLRVLDQRLVKQFDNLPAVIAELLLDLLLVGLNDGQEFVLLYVKNVGCKK